MARNERRGSATGSAQKHLRWTICGPISRYSLRLMHARWNDGSDDGAADPCRILSISQCDDAHSRIRRCEWLQLLLQARHKADEERVATRNDHLSVQLRA